MLQLARGGILVKLQESLGKSHLPGLRAFVRSRISSQVLNITNPCIAGESSHTTFIPPNMPVIANLYFSF